MLKLKQNTIYFCLCYADYLIILRTTNYIILHTVCLNTHNVIDNSTCPRHSNSCMDVIISQEQWSLTGSKCTIITKDMERKPLLLFLDESVSKYQEETWFSKPLYASVSRWPLNYLIYVKFQLPNINICI